MTKGNKRGRRSNAERIEAGKAVVAADPDLHAQMSAMEREVALVSQLAPSALAAAMRARRDALYIDATNRGQRPPLEKHDLGLLLAIATARVEAMLRAESNDNLRRAADHALSTLALYAGRELPVTFEASREEVGAHDRRDGPVARAQALVAKVADVSVSSVRRAVDRWGLMVRPPIV